MYIILHIYIIQTHTHRKITQQHIHDRVEIMKQTSNRIIIRMSG